MARPFSMAGLGLALAIGLAVFGVGSFRASGLAEGPGWVTLYEEDFESLQVGALAWEPDSYLPEDGMYSDDGALFRRRNVIPPRAYRASAAFGKDGWLTVEMYSRSRETRFQDLFSVADDPESPGNRVLRIQSPNHTDATVVRPTRMLPWTYRVCLRVGYAEFGDGKPGRDSRNGYLGDERLEPWVNREAAKENGFYWLTILDAVPRPHNNIWIHHHRKVVIDSDNNKDAWTEIWNGNRFIRSGEHPVMMFAVDAKGEADPLNGKPFSSYSAGQWQPSGKIRAVDAYKDNTWYRGCIERSRGLYTPTTCTASIDEKRAYHALGWPDYFMFGDPHNNSYRGRVLYGDIRLETRNE